MTAIDQASFAGRKVLTTLGNGQGLAYVDLGPRDAHPLLLIHGLSDNARSWSLMAPYLLPYFRLILPDLRGHGRSGAPECCYTRIDLAYDMKLLLDHLGLAAVAVVGHSLGSMVAYTLAARWPERVPRLVLESSSVRTGEQSGWLRDNVRRLEDPIDPDSPFMREWYGNAGAVDPDFHDHMRREAAAMPARIWRAMLADVLGYDATVLLAAVATPTVILHGTMDPLMTEASQAPLRAALPHAAFRSFAAFGHNPHWEDPELIAGAIRGFLRD